MRLWPLMLLALATTARADDRQLRTLQPQLVRGVVAVDGDTIRVGLETIRVVGLDAPEIFTVEQCGDPTSTRTVLMLGYAAQGYLQGLLNRGAIVQRLPYLDRYGRSLARVTVARGDVAEILISQGLARPYECPNNRCPRRQSWCRL